MSSIASFMVWLGNTPGSVALQESRYAYAIVESVHVWTLCLFVGFAALVDLRLVGVALRRVRVSDLLDRLLPWMRVGFAVMVVSGVVLFYALPVRSYHSVFFRLKVVLLLLAGLNAFVFHSGIYRRMAEWDLQALPPRSARLAGALSLVLWTGVVFSGRMIAYNWFDCAKPQTALIRTLAGCPTD